MRPAEMRPEGPAAPRPASDLPGPVERLRAATEAFRAELWTDAEAGFRASLGVWPAIDDVIRFWAVEAAVRAGRFDAARSDAESLAAGGGRYAGRAAYRAGEIALAQRRWADAGRIFADLSASGAYSTRRTPRSLDRAEVKLGMARALDGMGNAGEARALYESLIRWFPECPESLEAEMRLREIDRSFEIPAQWRLDRAGELVRHRDWAEAIDEIDRIPPGTRQPPPEEVAFARAMAVYKHRRRYDEAALGFAAVVAMHGPHEEEAALYRARSLSRATRNDEAVEAYHAFVRRYPRSPHADDARYAAASLEMYLGRLDDAIEALEAVVGARRSGPGHLDSRWALATAYMLSGRHREALELIDGTVDDDDGPLVRGRGLYWGAVARIELGRRAEATERLETVIRDYPLHYYALLARNRLVALGKEPPPPLPSRSLARADPDERCDDVPEEVAVLRAAGLLDDARALLLESLRPRIASATGDELLSIVRGLLCVEGVDVVHRHAASAHRSEIDSSLDESTLPFWIASYPRAYRDRVESACAREGVSPYLIWAIMRQESSFDRDVVSYADAIGLLQMIPPTTRRILEARGEPYDDALLFDPGANIDLGVGYIAWIGRKFHGQIPPLVGGYNGGPHNVARWFDDLGETRLDLFVERVPFGQTRNYIRRVITSYARYLYLYETDANEWPFDLADTLRLDYLPDPDF